MIRAFRTDDPKNASAAHVAEKTDWNMPNMLGIGA